MSKLQTLLHSLWFKVVGAFVLVLLVLSVAILGIVNSVTTREFDRYLAGRSDYIQRVVPTLLPIRPEISFNELPEVTLGSTPVIPTPGPELSIPDLDAALTNPPEIVVREITPRVVVVENLVQALSPSEAEASSLLFLADVRRRVQTAVFVAFLFAIILGTVLARQITHPLTKVRRATQALAQGDLSVRVPVKSRDEIGRVALAFNQMAANLEQQEQARRQMVADVAHELRTPLTVMKSNLEALLDGLIQPDPTELGELYDEVQRLNRMIEDLRLLSLADAGQLSLHREPVDVFALLETVIARLAPLAQAQNVSLPPPVHALPLVINADADKLQQAVGNLVDNALRHTPAGGRVAVTAVQEGKTAHISVSDSGPGIPPEDLPHLFDRFWRGDKSRSRHSGGSGLGLSIVQQIAELHGGRVTAVSPAGQGATFTISLPLNS